MLSRLIILRRLPYQLPRLISNLPIYTEQRERIPKKEPAKLYGELKLPSDFLNFLSEFNKDQQPSNESISQALEVVRPHHIRYIINQILKQNSSHALLTLLPYFLERNLISSNTIIPVTQCLSKAWIQHGPSDQMEEIAKTLLKQLTDFSPEGIIRNDLKILLSLLANEWPIENNEKIFMLKNDCFDALLIGALRHSDLKQLNLILKRFPFRFIHSNSDVFDVYLSFVKPKSKVLVGTYLKHLSGKIINKQTFHGIKRVLSASKSGSINASKVIEGKCGVCDAALPERDLTEEEFEKLRSTFSEYLKAGCETNKMGSKAEFYAIHPIVEKIKEREKSESAIVLDTLNIIGGRVELHNEFFNNVRELKTKYDIVVLILRPKMLNDKVFVLQQAGIDVFYVNKYTDDDLFAIYMTMCLGPKALLVSNDRFSDALHNLNSATDISDLFSIWTVNQVLGYKQPLRIQAPNIYSNLLDYSASKNSCHFMVFDDEWAATRKLFCLKT